MNYLTYKAAAFLFLVMLFVSVLSCKKSFSDDKKDSTVDKSNSIHLADPTIFHHEGTYYLYGTGGNTEGFLVYQSSDMKSWKGPVGKRGGYALVKGDTYGSKGFWAPQIFQSNNKFYMAYTADENIAIAESDSPLGPFKQQIVKAISGTGKQIDPFVFVDNDGKKYLYHVRLQNGNRLFVAEMTDDFSDIKPETVKECLAATLPWENTANAPWPVAEGPTVIKHNNLYYLFYSANDFRNIDYAVGYAVAPTPSGPWEKHTGNPIISRHSTGKNGSGHGDIIKDEKGNLMYVLHTHNSSQTVSPRVTGLVKIEFISNGLQYDKVSMEPGSFSYLQLLP